MIYIHAAQGGGLESFAVFRHAPSVLDLTFSQRMEFV